MAKLRANKPRVASANSPAVKVKRRDSQTDRPTLSSECQFSDSEGEWKRRNGGGEGDGLDSVEEEDGEEEDPQISEQTLGKITII